MAVRREGSEIEGGAKSSGGAWTMSWGISNVWDSEVGRVVEDEDGSDRVELSQSMIR